MNATQEAVTALQDIPSNTTPVVALIIAIAGMVSNLFLHYKVKHLEMGCIKSDCQEERKRRKSESPPETPPETPPLPPPTPPVKKKHHVHFPPDNVDEIQLKALSDLDV